MGKNERPWWAPDAQGFLSFAIVVLCGGVLFYRAQYPSTTDDKLLDTMITILFSTCLVSVYNFTFGSSRSSAMKDETQAKVAETLASKVEPKVDKDRPRLAWWALLSEEEKAAITEAGKIDGRVQTFIATSAAGRATVEDLEYLVAASVLSQARADALKVAA